MNKTELSSELLDFISKVRSPNLAFHIHQNHSARTQGTVSKVHRTSCKQRGLWPERCPESEPIPSLILSPFWHTDVYSHWNSLSPDSAMGLDWPSPEMMLLPSLMKSMAQQVTLGTMIRSSSLFSGVCHTRISFLEQVANRSEVPLENSERRDNKEGHTANTFFCQSWNHPSKLLSFQSAAVIFPRGYDKLIPNWLRQRPCWQKTPHVWFQHKDSF